MKQVFRFEGEEHPLGEFRGWLAADIYISQFMASKFEAPHYKMNDMFYSKGWQNLSGRGIDDLK